MPLKNLEDVLQPAYRNQYAVGAFNIVNLEFLQAVVSAAEAMKFPVILNIAEVHMQYFDVELICAALFKAVERSNIDFVLNLDHGLSFNTIEHAVKLGFSSVMFDGSLLTFEDNLRHTQEVVKLCHSAGVSVEAELGSVGGSEDGSVESMANPELYTNPKLAKEFVQKSGVNALAVAIGNSHGKYKGNPLLDFDLLRKINSALNIPLVLHGGSGISNLGFQNAIENGISKINFYTGMSESAMEEIKNNLNRYDSKYNNYPELMFSVKKAVQSRVEKQINIFRNGK